MKFNFSVSYEGYSYFFKVADGEAVCELPKGHKQLQDLASRRQVAKAAYKYLQSRAARVGLDESQIPPVRIGEFGPDDLPEPMPAAELPEAIVAGSTGEDDE